MIEKNDPLTCKGIFPMIAEWILLSISQEKKTKHTFTDASSEQEANNEPDGSHLTLLTSP